MVRKFIRAGLFGAFGAMAVLCAYGVVGAAPAADDNVPEISEVMKKAHGKGGFVAKVKEATKGEKWEDAQKYAKEFNSLAEVLGKNKQPKGPDASWKTQSDKYAANAKALVKAADAKDAKTVNATLGTIGGSCGGCHKSHKP